MGKEMFSGLDIDDIMKKIDKDIIVAEEERKKNCKKKTIKTIKFTVLTIVGVLTICFVGIFFVGILNSDDKEVANDNSYTQESSENKVSNSIPKHLRCSRCDGTGRVNKSFGKSWNKTYGYGYGDVCGACDGTGYDFD